MLNLGTVSYTSSQIEHMRTELAERLMEQSSNIDNPVITRISPEDLKIMFNLYDEIFFGHQFAREYQGKIKFSLSSRMSRTAGKTICSKNIGQLQPEQQVFEIRIGVGFFFNYDEIDKAKSVAGIVTGSSLEALQVVFEHELCHVIEYIMFKNSNCKQKRFKTLAGNLFGHTESTHQLPTSRQIVQEKYGFKIGDQVCFRFEEKKLEGILYRVNKRAIVMVRDKKGSFADKQGRRYAKYYVPVSLLEPPTQKS